MNQEIEAYLRIYCGNHLEAWMGHLSDLEFAHNQQAHAVTKQSPFFLMMECDPAVIPAIPTHLDSPTVAERLAKLTRVRHEALAAHELARQQMAERISRDFTPFKQGD